MRRLLLAAVAIAALCASSPAQAAFAPVRWCGTERAATDRLPDRAGGPQIHAIYAVPGDVASRFEAVASPLATDLAAIDVWWRAQDPTRAPRFDLFDFPGCESRFGLLDLSEARLVQPASSMFSLGDRFDRIVGELTDPPFDFVQLDKKYVVFYDGPVDADDVCGQGGGSPVLGQFSYAVIYLRSSCTASIGEGRGNALVTAHELLHALGMLPTTTPNACPDAAHVCDSSVDLLWPHYEGRDTLDGTLLDVNRDDYYAHAGSWFDLQESRWLLNALAQFPLTIRLDGRGVVETVADGQVCRAVCVREWDGASRIQLTAEAEPGYRFVGWRGGCATADVLACAVELTAPTEVVAVFRRVFALRIDVRGRGTVTAAAIRCSRTCRTDRVEGSATTLRATPARGWRFARWTGACRGTRSTCVVRRAGDARVGAVFARR